MIHVATLFQHSKQKIQIAALIADKAPVTVSTDDSDFENVFSKKSAVVLPKHTKINTYAINLEKDKQPLYGLIYTLGLVKLEILNIYVKTNLANSFIRLSKSPTGTPILLDKKVDKSLWLCVDYWRLNNITIKNGYLLLLVDKSLNCLDHAKQFTQLDLTSVYHRIRMKEDNK